MEINTILKAAYVTIVVLILFGATIFVHELGHFLFARRYKLRIERFSIGFGPKIWGYTKDGVDYRISVFPFGGYVALPQMAPLDEEEAKKFDPPLEHAKPFHKIIVAVAGAAFNIAFALLLALLIWWVGKPVDASDLDLTIGYVPDKLTEYRDRQPQTRPCPEYEAGLRVGDKIVAINDAPVADWTDVAQAVAFSRREAIRLEYLRDGEQRAAEFKPERSRVFGVRLLSAQPRSTPKIDKIEPNQPADGVGLQQNDEIVEVDDIRVLSGGHLLDLVAERRDQPTEFKIRRNEQELAFTITPRYDAEHKKTRIGVRFSPHTEQHTIYPDPWKQFKEVILMMANTINALVHHKQTGVGAKDLSGPVGIGHALWVMIPTDIRLGVSFTVLLNINLALINLLPIPVLDGGHIMFALFEWIRRKPIGYKFAAVTQTAFAVLLIGFILYVTYHDFLRLFRIAGLSDRGAQQEQPAEKPASTTPPAGGTPAPATP